MTKAIIPFLPHQWYSLYFHTLHKKNKALQSCKQVGKKILTSNLTTALMVPLKLHCFAPSHSLPTPPQVKVCPLGEPAIIWAQQKCLTSVCFSRFVHVWLHGRERRQHWLSLRNSSCIIRTRNCIKNRQKNSLFTGLEGPILNTTLSRICIMFRTRIWLHIAPLCITLDPAVALRCARKSEKICGYCCLGDIVR